MSFITYVTFTPACLLISFNILRSPGVWFCLSTLLHLVLYCFFFVLSDAKPQSTDTLIFRWSPGTALKHVQYGCA